MGILCFLWVSVVRSGIKSDHRPLCKNDSNPDNENFPKMLVRPTPSGAVLWFGCSPRPHDSGRWRHPEFRESECSLALDWIRRVKTFTFTAFHDVTEEHLVSAHILSFLRALLF